MGVVNQIIRHDERETDFLHVPLEPAGGVFAHIKRPHDFKVGDNVKLTITVEK